MWVQSTKVQKGFVIKRRVNKSSNTFKRNLSSTLSPVKNDNASKKFTSLLMKTIKPYSSTCLGLTSTSWCLYDSKHKKQFGFRQCYQREIASLTKIMTTILSIQTVQKFSIRPNLYIKVTDTCSKMIGTSANLKVGEWILLKDLYYGALLPSGNDAAYLLSQVIGFFLMASLNKGSIIHFKDFQEIDLTKQNTNNYVSQFIKKMNQKAIDLQLTLTNFSNPHGLQNALNISNAKDILNLSIYATSNQKFRKVMNCQTHRYQVKACENSEEKKQMRRWWNTNQLLKKGFEGVKTGQTITAGNCLSSLKNGIFIVVLNCKSNDDRFKQTEKLYEWYMENHLELIQSDQKIPNFQS